MPIRKCIIKRLQDNSCRAAYISRIFMFFRINQIFICVIVFNRCYLWLCQHERNLGRADHHGDKQQHTYNNADCSGWDQTANNGKNHRKGNVQQIVADNNDYCISKCHSRECMSSQTEENAKVNNED